MSRFAPALRRVAAELDLPRRVRSALLLEMAADLEAVYEHHRGRGLDEEAAARRAEETVLGSSEVIRRLGRLHAGSWRGWAEETGARLAGGLDLLLLSVGVLPILGLAAGVSVWALAADRSPVVVWAILLVGVLMAVLVATEPVRLLRDRAPRRRQLPSLLVLSAMAPALGLLAAVLGLSRAAADFAADPLAAPALVSTIARDGAALLAGLLLGIAGLLAWFVLIERDTRRAAREVDTLLADDAPDRAHPDPSGAPGAVLPLVRRRHG